MYAEKDFQLLDARTADVSVALPWRREQPYMSSDVVFSRHGWAADHLQSEHITAVIGKNGTGKSHLLSSIVRTFVALEEVQIGRRKATGSLSLNHLTYRVDGRHCSVRQDHKRKLQLMVNGEEVSLDKLPLPKRVVALTISPFDKFPVPRSLPHSVAPVETSMYQYLGLRDGFGKASIETLLYRSLNSLFDTSENEALRRSNIGAVFDFLSLEPVINIIYSLRGAGILRQVLKDGLPLNRPGLLTNYQTHRVLEIERGGVSEQELRMLLSIALERAKGGRIETRADFNTGGVLDDLFRRLQPVRRAGFMRLSGVEVTKKSGHTTDLRSASSGQLSMVSALVALASVIGNGSLVLIDEPELSLHPEWQVRYIDLLVRTFARYHGCHFVVATHSPLVVSELPAHANIISLDDIALPPTTELRGQSADFLLAEAFGLPTNGNLHVKDRIVRALQLVANGKANSEEFAIVLDDLIKFVDDLTDDDPSKTIINSLQEIADHAGRAVEQ